MSWRVKLMMSCREASRLVSERRDRELTFGERLGLRFHVLMCWFCKHYADQIDFLHETAHLLGHPPHDELPAGAGAALPPEAKDRMKRLLQSE